MFSITHAYLYLGYDFYAGHSIFHISFCIIFLYFVLYILSITDLCKIDNKFPSMAVRLLWFCFTTIYLSTGKNVVSSVSLIRLDFGHFLCISTSSYTNLSWFSIGQLPLYNKQSSLKEF